MSRSEAPRDFWLSSGFELLDRDGDGRLVVTDAFLRTYLARPEIVPPHDACIVERALHQRLMTSPRAAVTQSEIDDIADPDAIENWGHFLAFRDRLIAGPSLEATYIDLMRAPRVTIPPLFLDQLVHVIARNMLDGEGDPFVLRAAEMLFRPQRLAAKDGQLLLADEERVDGTTIDPHASPLVAMFGEATARTLDILGTGNADSYFARSDAFDLVMDFRQGQPARRAFATVIERWVRHLLGVTVAVEPLARIEAEPWLWYVGLDAAASRIGDALWRGDEPEADGRNRIVGLFRLTFEDPAIMLPRVAGAPVHLILAITPGRLIRVKPQNLVTGLPLREGT